MAEELDIDEIIEEEEEEEEENAYEKEREERIKRNMAKLEELQVMMHAGDEHHLSTAAYVLHDDNTDSQYHTLLACSKNAAWLQACHCDPINK